jgi:hypothetical protein
MVAPLIAAAVGTGARWLGARALSMLFGTATRTAITAVTADQMLNDGRVTKSALGAVTGGLTGSFQQTLGLTGEDGKTDWTKIGGLGLTMAIGTSVLNNVLGTPLALIATAALAFMFRDQIGGLSHKFAQAVGLEHNNAPAQTADARNDGTGPLMAARGPIDPAAEQSPEYQQTLQELSRLSRGLGTPSGP